MRNLLKVSAVFVFMLVFVVRPQAQAAIENKDDDVTTLIVTGYSLHSRLLADLLQFHTKQPVVFITRPDAKEVLFVPAQKNTNPAPPQTPIKISASEFHNFVNFAHPKQVVLLGEERFIPKHYRDVINPNIKTYALTDKNWTIIATQCEELFGIKGLAKKYQAELDRLARGGANVGSPQASEPRIVMPK
ncbi:hypothetical protein PQO03_01930 [Lentisphaera profundi]|uniref:Fe/B12 periplasmic-binding domain-containing protein n=1 Tax=Lentisphaera profundi TaxID=1658616 RepID=A0ABY7VRQ8_9BACT|nr:hypothetical protein [Lentisphaera profundi]WDE96722.1 hypothetical protein PQO03_01930 [Lentisphaera profundi]